MKDENSARVKWMILSLLGRDESAVELVRFCEDSARYAFLDRYDPPVAYLQPPRFSLCPLTIVLHSYEYGI